MGLIIEMVSADNESVGYLMPSSFDDVAAKIDCVQNSNVNKGSSRFLITNNLIILFFATKLIKIDYISLDFIELKSLLRSI